MAHSQNDVVYGINCLICNPKISKYVVFLKVDILSTSTHPSLVIPNLPT